VLAVVSLHARHFSPNISQDYSIDDIHQAALGEFENDLAAIRRLNAAYVEAQTLYIFTLMELRAAKADEQ
jgi:hypothetical protein